MKGKRISLFAAVCCLALLFGGCARHSCPKPWVSDSVLTPGEEDYAVIRLQSAAELEALREVARSADEEAAQDYLRRPGYERITRADLTACVNLLDVLPYLPIPQGEISSVAYYPSFPYLTVTGKRGDDRVVLVYSLDEDVPPDETEGREVGSLPAEPFLCCDGRVTVYREERGRDAVVWYAAAEGLFLRVYAYTGDPDRVVTEDLFAGLTVCRLGDFFAGS